jgi:crotonobetaine/carnitine-CoA ligase
MYEWLRKEARWVLPKVLAYQARVRPNDTFVIWSATGETLTYAQAASEAEQVASMFAAMGLGQTETVAVMLPNGLDFVRAWLGLMRLGATAVLLNPELRGSFLEHQLRNAGCRIVLTEAALRERIAEVAANVPKLTTVMLTDAGERSVGFKQWRSATPYDGPMPLARDIACVMYTSGTTGPAKGVLMPHAHCFLMGLGIIDNLRVTADDRYYIVLPLFHANGLLLQLGATLIAGASAVLRERFSASAWLQEIRHFRATATNMLGVVAAFVVATPPSAFDRDHQLRVICNVPNTPEHDRIFRDRFGVAEVIGAFGMTEVNIPLYGEYGRPHAGTCGRVYDRYFEVEIRDPENDQLLPRGTVGEIMVRPKAAFGFMAGYRDMPDRTVEAWRNLWFHTGDAGVMAEDGYVTYVDRIKDCIRRRGENISSFEVELAISRLQGVAEVAAYAVPSGISGGEDEIMLAVVLAEGATLDPAIVATYADNVLPRFAQPRFIDIVDGLPKTPTAKVQKSVLRTRGITPATWDRRANPST